jgi:hypothetical protein
MYDLVNQAIRLHAEIDTVVKGLSTKFNTEVNFTQTRSPQEGDENDTFLIQHKPN